jgi:hypothetical protein
MDDVLEVTFCIVYISYDKNYRKSFIVHIYNSLGIFINMDDLLKNKISQYPFNTYIREDSINIENEMLKITRVVPTRKIIDIDNFDGRITWKGLLTQPQDQGKCGSCWAYASTSMLSDRFNIISSGKINIVLSATKLILCDWSGSELLVNNPDDEFYKTVKLNRSGLKNSCYGNSLIDAFRYLSVYGTCSIECIPNTNELGLNKNFQQLGKFDNNITSLPFCSDISGPYNDMCSNFYIDEKNKSEYGDVQKLYRSWNFCCIAGTEKYGGKELYIRDNIYKWGPVSSAFKIYADFYSFDAKNDIYRWNGKGDQLGGHAIVIVGWGEKNGVKYWIIKNSWSTNWGDGGYFKIVRGVNECDIENNVISAMPDFFFPKRYDFNGVYNIMFEQQDEIIRERESINDIDTLAGGIDRTTGYSRRVMENKPWLNFQRPVPLAELPNWSTFIAGSDVKPIEYTEYTDIVHILFIFLLILTVIVIIRYIQRKVV